MKASTQETITPARKMKNNPVTLDKLSSLKRLSLTVDEHSDRSNLEVDEKQERRICLVSINVSLV